MSTAEKLLDRMRNNPRGWKLDSLEIIARRMGMTADHRGGSHYVFRHPSVPGHVCVPKHRPVGPVYIRQFLALVDAVKEKNP